MHHQASEWSRGRGDVIITHLEYGIITILHLVGETIDATRAYHRAQAGTLVRLVRGVYVESESDIEAVVLGHAMRIARYLHPQRLPVVSECISVGAGTGSTAVHHRPRRNQRTRIHTLEIIQNVAPKDPSTASAVIGDDLGELRVDVSSPRQRFLEAFRLRSEHASSITPRMRNRMAARLVEEYVSPQVAADSVWGLAKMNGWFQEGKLAERFFLHQPGEATVPANRAALDLLVFWHGELLGHLTHDGFEWRWKPQKGGGPALVRKTTPGKLPLFIESLLPEGWLAQILGEQRT